MNEAQVFKARKGNRQQLYRQNLALLKQMDARFRREGKIKWRDFITVWKYGKDYGTREFKGAMNKLYNIVANLGGGGGGTVWPKEEKNRVRRIPQFMGAAIRILESQGPQ